MRRMSRHIAEPLACSRCSCLCLLRVLADSCFGAIFASQSYVSKLEIANTCCNCKFNFRSPLLVVNIKFLYRILRTAELHASKWLANFEFSFSLRKQGRISFGSQLSDMHSLACAMSQIERWQMAILMITTRSTQSVCMSLL